MTTEKILITGSNGQLGSELNTLASSLVGFNFLFHDVDTLDITDLKSLTGFFKEHKPGYIINCAAYTAVDKAETDIEKAYLINDNALENLAKVAIQFNARIIHISTDYVFDGINHRPYIETDLTNPASVYGKSKLAGEKHLENLTNAIIIRTAWLYSSFGNNFVKTVIRLGKERQELRMICDQVGTPTYAADLANAIVQILKKSVGHQDGFVPGIYHYSDEGACSWYDFASEIISQSNLSCKVSPIGTKDYPTPAKRPPYSVFNKSKIKETFGIEIPWWKDSLKVCLDIIPK
jgi:dTDP-4-dehydrorhamnose reductase